MRITIIAAIGTNNVIGKNNTLPWRLKTDLKMFKRTTTGKAVVMGRKTFESIGKALPNRTNVILSRQSMEVPGCIVVQSRDTVLDKLKDHNEIFIIGGRSIYELFLTIADKLLITKVYTTVAGDVEFPNIDWRQWRRISYEYHKKSDSDEYNFAFTEYIRN